MTIFEQHRKEEHLVHWNSALRTNVSAGNHDCQVPFPNHHFLSNTIHARIKSITLTNLFHNIYGNAANLFIDFGGITEISFGPQTIKTTGELDTLLQASLTSVVGGTITVVTDADNFMTITSTTPFSILTPSEVYDFNGERLSMNALIGRSSTSAQTVTPYTFESKVSLIGVRKVRFSSSNIAGGRSIHAHGNVGNVITSLSLHDVDHGFTKTVEYEDSDNARINFRESRDCAHIDFKLFDEYDQPLTLPENAHVDIEMIFTSITS